MTNSVFLLAIVATPIDRPNAWFLLMRTTINRPITLVKIVEMSNNMQAELYLCSYRLRNVRAGYVLYRALVFYCDIFMYMYM